MDTDVEQPQSVPPPTTSTLDTASSLRAAALLSRKRRRVDGDAPALPPRLAPEPTLQLDYGYDDPAATQSDRKSSPVLQPTVPEPTDLLEDIEDGQIREEGEISDSETSPPPLRSPTPPPRLRQRLFTFQPQESARVEIPLPPRPPSRIEAPIASPLEPSDAQAWQPSSLEPFVLETSTYQLDADHVRPGLAMTQNQYSTAKDIVLDLLGWGVPPEYLLECGLSRHVIFYVFSELNLRLPSNLDTSGLIPYPTPEMLALIPVSPSLSARSLYSSSSAMPPPSIIPARVSLTERMSMERIDTRMTSPDRSPYIKAEPSSPSSADLSNSHSLLVIEQQRRQELLARKAVIASRKARQSEPPGFATSPKDQDIDMGAVPAQSVDDFLKTIEPASHLDTGDSDKLNRGSSIGTASFSSLERMDVDDLIPGLVGASGDTFISSAGPSSSASKSSSSTVIYTEFHSPVAPPTGSVDNAGSARNGTELDSTTSVDVAGSGSLTPTFQGNLSHTSLDSDGGYPPRRGMKRPVAADFVDFNSGLGPSRGHGSSSSNGYSNGGPYPNPLSRRKAGSFAGISGMRRCVIELSDSEDDGDNQVGGDYVGNSDVREYSPAVTTTFITRAPPRLTATPTIPSSLGSSGVTNGNMGQPLSTAPATNALAEKEEEIKRMRQLIAQREELRLKKLVAMSGKSTPVIPPTAEVQTPEGTVMVKQDETLLDSLGRKYSSTLLPSRNRENDRPSIPELTRRHDISAAVLDGRPDPLTSDYSAMACNPGTPGPAGNRNDLSAQETSTIGREPSVQDGDSEDDQDLTVTGETQSAQVVPSSKEDIHQETLAAGDSGTPSSAQVLRPQLPQSRNEAPPQLSRSSFPLYDSPLSRYPLLRPRFGPDPSVRNTSFVNLQSEITTASQAGARSTSPPSVHFPSPIACTTGAVSSHSSSPIPLPDLKELKQAVLHRSLAQLARRSTDLRVCPYEVPGGGVCRDKDCGELHLSRIAMEPSDTEVARYVHEMLSQPWSGRCDVRAIEIALEGVRLRGGATDVDSRVREALGGLGIPMI